MAELKTKPTRAGVRAFLRAIEDPVRRADCLELLAMMRDASGKPARMWGTSIVGFGSYHYRYASGREGDWMVTGFAPRKRDISVYIMPGFDDYAPLLDKLGRHKTGRSCLTIRTLDEIDRKTLKRLVSRAIEDMYERYPCT